MATRGRFGKHSTLPESLQVVTHVKENCNAKKLISSERPPKILQNEIKIIKIGQAVLETFNFKDRNLDNSTRINERKTENVVFKSFAQTEKQ